MLGHVVNQIPAPSQQPKDDNVTDQPKEVDLQPEEQRDRHRRLSLYKSTQIALTITEQGTKCLPPSKIVMYVRIAEFEILDVLTSSTKQLPPGIFLLGSFPLNKDIFFFK